MPAPDPFESPTPPRKHYALKPKERFHRANPTGPAPDSAAHDVYAWRAQAEAGSPPPDETLLSPAPAYGYRRRRDYWVLMLAGNGFLGIVTLLGRDNLMVVVSGATGMIVFTLGLTWAMWQVMSKY